MELPVNYSNTPPQERRAVREEYIKIQEGNCYHCGAPLKDSPTRKVSNLYVNKRLFPEGFFNHPTHLHHSHDTGMTIGAVHAYCNAVLWQYHGE
jgi:hypothetical protein